MHFIIKIYSNNRYDALEKIEDEISSSNEKYNFWSTSFSHNTANTKTVQLPYYPEMIVVTEDNGYVNAAMAKLPGIIVNEGEWVKCSFSGAEVTLMNGIEAGLSTTTTITIYIWYK